MPNQNIENLDPRKYIIIKGARMHNLKNVSVAIPRNKFVVITGLSGSGKSSLAFDTLYAEGQRRYVESLSAYARQFLGKIEKPDVDGILGISPAIAIEQKVNTRNSRSTVGTTTEIYDYLKLLYTRIGKTYSPISGNEVKKHTTTHVVDELLLQPEGAKFYVLAPLLIEGGRTVSEQLDLLYKQGFTRVVLNNEVQKIEDLLTESFDAANCHLMIDRLAVRNDEETLNRLVDSIETAFYEGQGTCIIGLLTDNKTMNLMEFNNRFELDGMVFEEPTQHFFTFNNPVGACKRCEGFGSIVGIDPDLVIPNKNLSVYEDCILPWKGERMGEWKDTLLYSAHKHDFPVHKPYKDLTAAQKELLWTGNQYFDGLNAFFKFLESESYKIQYRVMLSRYRGKTTCPECNGTRLRKDAAYVKIAGKHISELVLLQIDELAKFFNTLELTEYEQKVAKRLLLEINNRLAYLQDVGLGYLTLNRLSSSLSGGESQRINLATSLGSSLVGSMYILDEPSIGLHSRDTERLINVLRSLNKQGNTVIVVEHDEDIMQAADQIIDLGPMAGTHGGNLVFQGDHSELISSTASTTAKYLTGRLKILVPPKTRKWNSYIEVVNAHENNLKHVTVKFPLNTLTCVSGVSGSGKSSLVKKVLYPALKKMFGGYGEQTGKYENLQGDIGSLSGVEFIDQNPIGKSSRSNPVTYIKAYDEIRNLFANQQLSKIRGYKPAHFSFNVEGGRCETCQGEGEVTVEMQFMADIHLTCETCKGQKFKDEILEVTYNNLNIFQVLELTVDDAIEFFSKSTDKKVLKVVDKLKPLQDVGLGYVQLGQSSSTLSGGEAQRIKLASFLAKGKASKGILFVFDEPTTGLHFHDVSKLLTAFQALIDLGNSLIVIEHNLDVIKCADWVIDVGPEGGDKGGEIVFEGTPAELARTTRTFTGKYLAEKFNESVEAE